MTILQSMSWILFSSLIGTIWVLGDLLAQKLEHHKNIDWKRTGRMATYGFLIAGQFCIVCWRGRGLERVHLNQATRSNVTHLVFLFFNLLVFRSSA
jgi:hypothetical protein